MVGSNLHVLLLAVLFLPLLSCGSLRVEETTYETVSAPGQPFSGNRALIHIRNLTSNEMEGRQSGVTGGRRAARYIQDQFKGFGLEPGGDSGTFLQQFPMLVSRLVRAEMKIVDSPFGPIDLIVHEDFYPLTHSGSGDVTGEAVFVGFGISKPEKGWDDYGTTDVRGKIVVVIRGNPPVPDQDWSAEYSRNYTVNEAYERGAAAVLFLQGSKIIHGAAIQEEAYHEDLPLAYIDEHVAEKLLPRLGVTLDSYKETLKSGPKVLNTNRNLHIRFEVEPVPDGVAYNVIGILPGEHPVLKNEYIVVGGHMDHIGICPGGLRFDGANDNASGTSVVLELARAFSEAKRRCARSLIFAAFAAEEQGLLGSKFMANHLPVDKDRVAMMLNYDMAGHGGGEVGFGGGEFFPALWRTFMRQADPSLGEKILATRAWGGGSDQSSFREVGIPVFSVWSRGSHLFYHTISDTVEWIKEEVVHAVGSVSESAITCFADWPEPLTQATLAERRLMWEGCQIDFLAAWNGFLGSGISPELASRLMEGPGFVRGALWNVESLPSPATAEKGPPPGEGSPIARIFDMLSHLDRDVAPALLGTAFNEVKNNKGGHGFTFLPCLPLKIVQGFEDKALPILKGLGIAFLVAEAKDLTDVTFTKSIPLVTRLEPGTTHLPDQWENLIVVCTESSPGWLDQVKGFADRKAFFVIRIPGPDMDLRLLQKTIEAIDPGRCHLDLTGLLSQPEISDEEEVLFDFVRRLRQSGFDEKTLKKLLGGNLLQWPTIK